MDSPETRAANDAKKELESAWHKHRLRCGQCSSKTAGRCRAGAELHDGLAAAVLLLRHERAADKAPNPAQGRLF